VSSYGCGEEISNGGKGVGAGVRIGERGPRRPTGARFSRRRWRDRFWRRAGAVAEVPGVHNRLLRDWKRGWNLDGDRDGCSEGVDDGICGIAGVFWSESCAALHGGVNECLSG